MIVWLASYPRSGNTFLRLVLHRLYGLPTYSVYDDNDPVAQRVGPDLVGYAAKPDDRGLMVSGPDLYFVKTHKRRKADGHRAICLVRDGRDAVVSYAHLRAEKDDSDDEPDAVFERCLREEITRPFLPDHPSSGSWGGHVLSWLAADVPLALIRYEALIAHPRETVEHAVSAVAPELVPRSGVHIPTFEALHGVDPAFFRRGKAGSHKDEMPRELEAIFWAQPENADAMQRLGYAR
jgi:hypothetical protein